MGRHSDGLRPATVEELAAAERADRSPRPERIKRPIVIAIATAVLLAAGAGAFALARNDSNQPTFKPPLGDAAPFGVGYVDGFGEHTPTPSSPGKPKPKPPKAPSFSAPTSSPARAGIGFAPSAAPSADPPASTGGGRVASQAPSPDATVVSGLSAVYWTMSWRGTYDVYVWVHNDGPDPVRWQVTMQLQPGATISTFWATTGVSLGRDTWQFTPTESPTLRAGSTYLFAIEARRSEGPFTVSSCSVNGVSCTPFG